MTFTLVCVFLVIFVVILAVTALIAELFDEPGVAWAISSFGFGICLTILLYTYGFIK